MPVKRIALLMALAPTLLVVPPAGADPRWRLDLSGRGIGSVELSGSADQMRDGFVPAIGVRALRRVGSLQLGGSIGAGFPAWYGKAEAVLSVDHERVLAEQHRGARWSVSAGLDGGVGLLYAGAPPETSASSNALMYWGPLVRARFQLHVLDVLPSSRAIGLVVGANAAFTAARYMSTATGTGVLGMTAGSGSSCA